MAGVWHGEAGEGACWAAGCEHGYYYLDGDAVGGVCSVGDIKRWRRSGGKARNQCMHKGEAEVEDNTAMHRGKVNHAITYMDSPN